MQRIVSFLLLLFLPVAALADGKVIPLAAYPARVTIPDQRALICYTNGTERLVIETRFNGAGTNFAWVVPLPGQPVIEKATTGLFPTLGYLFRPQIVHNVSRYWLETLAAIGLIYLFRRLIKYTSTGFTIFIAFLLLFLAGFLLPVLTAAGRKGMESASSEQNVSILDRKPVGVFETTTIGSHNAKALQNWLSENGYAVPTNAEPVIASYVKEGWVFVAAKVRRNKPDNETNTPHPLSFTFKTDQPVYPMRLTGVDNGPVSVELYVFGSSRAGAAHFKVESCTRPNIAHPLLRTWVGDLATATLLTATLSPADMRNDVWLDWTPFSEKENRLFSQQGALTVALNWGAGLFAAGLLAVYLLAFASETHKIKLRRRIGIVTLAGIVLAGLLYLCLPKIEVKLVKARSYINASTEQKIVLEMILDDGGWQNVAEARAILQQATSNPTNAVAYDMKDWNNNLAGGQIREEDSPGNYLLRETNNQLHFVSIGADGGEYVLNHWDLPARHQTP